MDPLKLGLFEEIIGRRQMVPLDLLLGPFEESNGRCQMVSLDLLLGLFEEIIGHRQMIPLDLLLGLFAEIIGHRQMVPLRLLLSLSVLPITRAILRQIPELKSNGADLRRSTAVVKWFRLLLLVGRFEEIQGCRQMVPLVVDGTI